MRRGSLMARLHGRVRTLLLYSRGYGGMGFAGWEAAVKILFANNIRGYFGGVEQVIVDTARGLGRRGHECFLAYAVEGRDVAAFSEPFAGCAACSEFGAGAPLNGSKTFVEIAGRLRPDVVYYHKVTKLPGGWKPFPMVRAVRMVHDHDMYCPRGYKYFVHNGRVCHHRAGWRCWADLAFLKRDRGSRLGIGYAPISAKIAEMRRNRELDLILPVSSYIRDQLVMNGYPEDRVRVLHPILPVEEPHPTPVPSEPHILFVGQLIRGKGLDLLFRAMTKLTTPFTATVVGTGNGEEKSKALCAELGLSSKVQFVPWVSHDDIGGYYARAKVVAAPSRWPEPFTLVGQEAMRHGRAVVAFHVGGNADWLEHDRTGLLVPEQDIDAYATALDRVLSDTDLATRLGDAARTRVRERFSFEKYLDELEDALSGGRVIGAEHLG